MERFNLRDYVFSLGTLRWWNEHKQHEMSVLSRVCLNINVSSGSFNVTTWGKVLDKVTVTQLIKKFPSFLGIRKFITSFTGTCHRSLSWATRLRYISKKNFLQHAFNIILPSTSISPKWSYLRVLRLIFCTHFSSLHCVLHEMIPSPVLPLRSALILLW